LREVQERKKLEQDKIKAEEEKLDLRIKNGLQSSTSI